jgi:Tfp pilus assembly protein PilX
MKFALKRKNSKAGYGTLGVIIVVVLVVIVLAFFGFAGMHL